MSASTRAPALSERLAAWRDGGHFLVVGDQRIYWREAGDGPVLLLIHGFPTASWDWHAILEPLVARYRVLCCDLLGFGFSSKPWPHRYTIAAQADVCEALLAHRSVDTCHVLAHDYGDTVAQELLARHNARTMGATIDSLCLLNGGLFPETHRARLVQRLLAGPLGGLVTRLMNRSKFDRSMRAIFGAATQPSDAELADFWSLVEHGTGRRVMRGLIRYMDERKAYRSRWVGALQETDVPVRLIAGLDDPVSGAHMVARYRELVPEPDVVELDGIGHYPQVEAPERVLDACLPFLARHARAREGSPGS